MVLLSLEETKDDHIHPQTSEGLAKAEEMVEVVGEDAGE